MRPLPPQRVTLLGKSFPKGTTSWRTSGAKAPYQSLRATSSLQSSGTKPACLCGSGRRAGNLAFVWARGEKRDCPVPFYGTERGSLQSGTSVAALLAKTDRGIPDFYSVPPLLLPSFFIPLLPSRCSPMLVGQLIRECRDIFFQELVRILRRDDHTGRLTVGLGVGLRSNLKMIDAWFLRTVSVCGSQASCCSARIAGKQGSEGWCARPK